MKKSEKGGVAARPDDPEFEPIQHVMKMINELFKVNHVRLDHAISAMANLIYTYMKEYRDREEYEAFMENVKNLWRMHDEEAGK